MATPRVIHLHPGELPEHSAPTLEPNAAQKASELLMENNKNYHIFFNTSGFHNHLVHHLLTVYALGASPETIAKQFEVNKEYQREMAPVDTSVVVQLHYKEKWKQCVGNEKYYNDFLTFFKAEMEWKGWEQVIKEYLLARDERANDLLVRMYNGLLHPVIHLGFGIEFKQPAIIAEALAQAAVHKSWIGDLFLGVEKAQAEVKPNTPSKSIVELLDEIHADKKLSTAAHWDDGNMIRDGILQRAPEEMIHYASQYTVGPDELDEKMAEMINAVAYFTGAAQRPSKQIKFDFFLMHSLNCSIFFPVFMKQTWLSKEDRARLLSWKVWADLVQYASKRSPDLLLDEVRDYKPKIPGNSWEPLFKRGREILEDGHCPKLIRALAHGQSVSAPYEDKDSFRIKGDMWLQLAHMGMDSCEDGGENWVRSAGFDEAWESFGPRTQW